MKEGAYISLFRTSYSCQGGQSLLAGSFKDKAGAKSFPTSETQSCWRLEKDEEGEKEKEAFGTSECPQQGSGTVTKKPSKSLRSARETESTGRKLQ